MKNDSFELDSYERAVMHYGHQVAEQASDFNFNFYQYEHPERLQLHSRRESNKQKAGINPLHESQPKFKRKSQSSSKPQTEPIHRQRKDR